MLRTPETLSTHSSPLESTADIEPRWASILQAIVSHREPHARWLNTLSYLEHVGSRKIVKALDTMSLDETVLRHISEEARHAHFFKRLSLRVMPDRCPTFDDAYLFLGDDAKSYFRDLDQRVAEYLESRLDAANPFVNYLCVTTLIELRATAIYGVYEQVLRASSSAVSLRSVLAEENRHMQEMWAAFEKGCFSWSVHEAALRDIERSLFLRWTEALEREAGRLVTLQQS